MAEVGRGTAPTSVSIVLPTYNERRNIVPLVQSLLEELDAAHLAAEIWVVDDQSPDGTAEAVRAAFSARPEVRVHVRTADPGLAQSIYTGIMKATRDTVVVMDSDFNHDPRLVPLMVRQLADFDLVVGSRYVLGGGMEETWRYWASFGYNLALRLYLGTQVHDNLSGYFAVRRDVLAPIIARVMFRGYGEYFIRLLCATQRAGLTTLEVPAYYWTRRFGTTKSRFWSMLWTYTATAMYLRWKGPRLPRRGTTPYVPPGAATGQDAHPRLEG